MVVVASSQPKVTAAARNAFSRPVPASAQSSGVKIAEIIAMKRLKRLPLGRLAPPSRSRMPPSFEILPDRGEDLGHVVADDDLVLAAGLGRGDDAGGGLQRRGIRLGLVLQDEPEPGRAVHERLTFFSPPTPLRTPPRSSRNPPSGFAFLSPLHCGRRVLAGMPGRGTVFGQKKDLNSFIARQRCEFRFCPLAR